MKYALFIIFAWLICFTAFPNQSPEELDSLVRRLKTIPAEGKCNLLNQIASGYLSSNPQTSYEYASQAFELALELHDKNAEGIAQLNMGKSLILRGEYEPSLPFIQKALSVSEELNNRSMRANSFNLLANYYQAGGNLSKALDTFNEGLSILSSPQDDKDIAMIESNLANLYITTGEYRKAMDIFFEVLKIYEALGSDENIATVKNNIAISYHQMQNYDQAMDYYQQALTIYQKLGQVSNQVVPLNNIAEIYKDLGQYDKAIEYFRQCYGLGIFLDNEQYKGMGLTGLGETYLLAGKINEAAKNLEEARAIFETQNYNEGLATIYYCLGELAFRNGDSKTAKSWYDKSLGYSEKLQMVEQMGKNYQALSNLAVLSGDYRSAYEYYRSFSIISDSVYKENRESLISEMMAKYDLDKKQTEISALQKNNDSIQTALKQKKLHYQILIGLIFCLFVILGLLIRQFFMKRNSNRELRTSYDRIAEQKDELEQLNATKDKLISIIAHDLRGPVGTTKSMLNQLVKAPEVFSKEDQAQITEELYLVSEKTYDLLENLLSWANNHRGLRISKDAFSVKKLVESNVEQQEFFAEKKGIRLYSQITNDCTVLCDVNMINLVIRNLISNAIKFTPPKGSITLSGYRKENYYKILVQDNGIGMAPEVMSRIFDSRDFYTTYGTNREKGSGLGLKLCKEFVEKNGGKISVESDQGQGTTFAFTLEVAPSQPSTDKSDRSDRLEKPFASDSSDKSISRMPNLGAKV